MKIEIPTNCPCCNSTLELIKDQLFCRNTACGAQLNKKLEHFCRVLNIKGFGPKTVEKLALSDITEIFYLDRDQLIESLSSDKLADKLLLEIEKSKTADLATVLSALSIPLLGGSSATKLCATINTVDEINADTCKKAGLGEKVTANLLDWLSTDFIEMREFLPFTFKSSSYASSKPTGDTICITGKLSSVKTKTEATSLLEAAGYTVVNSVTKTTKYLLDEGDKGSEKRIKAEQYGIEIINNLYKFLNKE